MAKKTKYIKLINGEIVLQKAILRIVKGVSNSKPVAFVYYNNTDNHSRLEFGSETEYNIEIARLSKILGVS